MRFSGKTAVITGAAVGIGRAAAVKFAAEGARVVALDLNEEALNDLHREIVERGGEALTMVCDVSDESAVNAAFEASRARFGKIDILVNNAGLWRYFDSFLEVTVEHWIKLMNVNVMSMVYCTRAALPDMIDSGWGRIVNVASVAGVYGNAKMVPYSATKGAIISMTQALAKEVAAQGVTVNAISPGTVTPAEKMDYYAHQESSANYMKRTGSTMENADLIVFLASDEASYISGQNIQIDGCRRTI